MRTVPPITVHVNGPLFQGDGRLFERNLALSSGAGKSWLLSGNKARPLDTRAFGASRMFSRCRRLDVTQNGHPSSLITPFAMPLPCGYKRLASYEKLASISVQRQTRVAEMKGRFDTMAILATHALLNYLGRQCPFANLEFAPDVRLGRPGALKRRYISHEVLGLNFSSLSP